MTTTLLLVVSALLVGVLIGCVGIGGVLLPPALAYVGGLELHLAMATAMWSFLFTGIAGTVAYARRRSLDLRMAAWLSAGVIPAALLGARSNVFLSENVLTVLLAVLLVATGANALMRSRTFERPSGSPGTRTLLLVGVLVGFGSSLTGTGGPVMLVPILLLLRTPVLVAVGVSQVVQIPVAASATLGYVLYGQTNFTLGTALGIVEVAGVIIGTRIAHTVPALQLRRLVAIALIATGLSLVVRTFGPTVAGWVPLGIDPLHRKTDASGLSSDQAAKSPVTDPAALFTPTFGQAGEIAGVVSCPRRDRAVAFVPTSRAEPKA
jgi:uncharacterized membrane protein YfcA